MRRDQMLLHVQYTENGREMPAAHSCWDKAEFCRSPGSCRALICLPWKCVLAFRANDDDDVAAPGRGVGLGAPMGLECTLIGRLQFASRQIPGLGFEALFPVGQNPSARAWTRVRSSFTDSRRQPMNREVTFESRQPMV
jgi:hypothetical protein